MLGGLGVWLSSNANLIRARTGEGRARAKARGEHIGRPRKLNAHQRQEARARREAGETVTDIARAPMASLIPR
jgi:DNA invertase Pin-like site-specific DNA recombinase